MNLVFNDSTEITIQSADYVDNALNVKIVGIDRESILNMFQDKNKTNKITVKENRESTVYERMVWESLTEYTGGIFEVTMIQEGKSALEQIAELKSTLEPVTAAIRSEVIPSDKKGYDFKCVYIGEMLITKEYVKSETESEDDGSDYTTAILWNDGDSVTSGLWYKFDDGNVWQAIKTGVPSSATDNEYFDIIG